MRHSCLKFDVQKFQGLSNPEILGEFWPSLWEMGIFPVKILMFLLQAFKKFQTTDCRKYLAQHDSFSTKVMGWGSRANLIPALDN